MLSRRQFLKLGIAATAAGAASQIRLPGTAYASFQVTQTPLAAKAIPKWVEPVPVFGPAGPIPRVDGTQPVTVNAYETQQMILPASFYTGLAAPFNAGTYVWAYKVGTSLPIPIYPGVSIEARRGTPTDVTYVNNLPMSPILHQYLTVDQSIHMAKPLGAELQPMMVMDPALGVMVGNPNPYMGPPPLTAHLHGGEISSRYDGGPGSWYTPDGIHGGSYASFVDLGSTYPGTVSHYVNEQEATTLWFHDHVLGLTRINVFAGLAAFYLLRDQWDTGLPNNPLGLPAGPFEIELALQDRQFDVNGQLLFPDGYPAGLNGAPSQPLIHKFWIPEFFGDTIVVNGKSWPFFEVEPRRFRFRLLNGCNARFLELYLMNMVTKLPGPDIYVIGNDGGLMDVPARIKAPKDRLRIAPGERYDVIIDFTNFAGQTLTVDNSAKAPYPGGANPDPNGNGQILQFRVTKPLSSPDTTYNPAAGLPLRTATTMPPMIRLADPATGTLAAGVTPDITRQLTLIEIEGPAGPIQVTVNNTSWDGTVAADGATPVGGDNTQDWEGDFITEHPRQGSTEVWEIVNLTMDAHPIHLHLTQFQLINRQPFQVKQYRAFYDSLFPGGTFPGVIGNKGPSAIWDSVNYPKGVFIPAYGPPLLPNGTPALCAGKHGGNPDVTPYLQGRPTPPLPEEAGWNDVIKMYPGEVTRIAVRFAPQDMAVGTTASGTNYYTFDPTDGPGYVWHCHIVDHEDNEMMRPYVIKG